jgi:type 2 lantibiotic biosynthesis protein LanM
MTNFNIKFAAQLLRGLPLDARLDNLTALTDAIHPSKYDQQRLSKWLGIFPTPTIAQTRLATLGLQQSDLQRLLAETPEQLQSRLDVPSWIQATERHYAEREQLIPIDLEAGVQGSFLTAIEPLLSDARATLHVELQRITSANVPIDLGQVYSSLLATLPGRLMGMLERVMVLELHIARLREQLAGETGAERFQSFLDRLRDPVVSTDILARYPVLTQQLHTQIAQWLQFSVEIVRHFCAENAEICQTFDIERDDALIAIEQGSGDRHRQGRSVCILKFASGVQLVYKPRSLSIDVHFQMLLDWVNNYADLPRFQTVKVLDYDKHGWMEFVHHMPCLTEAEVQRFYVRLGAYLALLYVLEASDFHYENLIAVGEQPILVDLESLFQPRLPISGPLAGTDQAFAAADALASSVMRVGLLPSRMWGNEDAEGIDLSGVGGEGGQWTPMKIPQWIDKSSDEMRLVREQIRMDAGQNRARLNDQDVNVLDYTDEFIDGFTRMYRLIQAHRDTLPASVLATFKQDLVRVILRDTAYYSQMLFESFHPDLLRDALDRDRYIDALWKATLQRPHLKQFAPAERSDILNGDVPLFNAPIAGHHIEDAHGDQYPDALAQSGFERVENRLETLSEDDLNRQLWFIRGSLGILVKHSHEALHKVNRQTRPQNVATADAYVAMARKIADHLARGAMRNAQGISWIGVVFGQSRQHTSLMPLGADLYSGLPGLALFFAYLNKVDNCVDYRGLAVEIVDTLQKHRDNVLPLLNLPGAFGGLSGLIYSYMHLADLLDQPDLLDEAVAMAYQLPDRLSNDNHYDIINGAAGAILVVLRLYDITQNALLLNIAERYGQHLLDTAQEQDGRLGWIVPGMGDAPLSGMSHGSAGIALALLRLADKTGQRQFANYAERAIEAENQLFAPERGNWADLRTFEGHRLEETYMTFWCHGAPGIGLARLNSLLLAHSTALEQQLIHDLQQALRTTLDQGFGYNHSICHGDLGNLDLLITTSQYLPDQVNAEDITRLGSLILEDMADHWKCGTPTGVETHGLMMGLAGIGYQLLRLANPQSVPSILTLEGPTC